MSNYDPRLPKHQRPMCRRCSYHVPISWPLPVVQMANLCAVPSSPTTHSKWSLHTYHYYLPHTVRSIANRTRDRCCFLLRERIWGRPNSSEAPSGLLYHIYCICTVVSTHPYHSCQNSLICIRVSRQVQTWRQLPRVASWYSTIMTDLLLLKTTATAIITANMNTNNAAKDTNTFTQ